MKQNEHTEPEPLDPRTIPLKPVPGETQFQHTRTGPKREYSGVDDVRTVQKVLGAGPKPGTFFVLDQHASTFIIFRRPDGSWWELK